MVVFVTVIYGIRADTDNNTSTFLIIEENIKRTTQYKALKVMLFIFIILIMSDKEGYHDLKAI